MSLFPGLKQNMYSRSLSTAWCYANSALAARKKQMARAFLSPISAQVRAVWPSPLRRSYQVRRFTLRTFPQLRSLSPRKMRLATWRQIAFTF